MFNRYLSLITETEANLFIHSDLDTRDANILRSVIEHPRFASSDSLSIILTRLCMSGAWTHQMHAYLVQRGAKFQSDKFSDFIKCDELEAMESILHQGDVSIDDIRKGFWTALAVAKYDVAHRLATAYEIYDGSFFTSLLERLELSSESRAVLTSCDTKH